MLPGRWCWRDHQWAGWAEIGGLVGRAAGKIAWPGLVGIAPARPISPAGATPRGSALRLLARGETLFEPNPYGPEPTPTHAGFFADAECHLRLDGEINLSCPVRLIHGQRDADVPWDVSLRLAAALRSDDIQVTLIKDGDHRLSRECDITHLKAMVAGFYG